ncbi:MAG: HAMP domain-containing histidine kinase [bacterium]|nr:HAMP domain-containing histidine kinase [bacterium]MCP5067356.1 HAMP domain-containing histidine kinase [bacterium]
MSATRDAELASAILDIRAPLSRVELAASRLDREDRTPRSGELAQSIHEAVAAIDRQLELALRVLSPSSPGRERPSGPVLEELTERLRPVFAARGLELQVAAKHSPSLDPAVLRRAVIALTGAAAEQAQPGLLEVGLVAGDGCWGVEARWQPRGEGSQNAADILKRLQPLALLCGAEAEVTADGAVFWIPAGELD